MLVGESGYRLATWAGLSPAEFRERARLVNVYRELPPRWGRPFARGRAEELAVDAERAGAERVVLLGERVAAAFDYTAPPFEWHPTAMLPTQLVALVPHPSGLNRYWNEPVNRRLVERFLRRLFGVPMPARQPRLGMFAGPARDLAS